ncbi:MAG: hypothetical protein QW412_00790 [Candidatus Aenigmatarchaeota archaeon]
MEEKTMLGIAYILSLVPVVNLVGFILLIVGWIKLGNKYKENLWKWVGYSAILAIIAAIITFITLFESLSTGGIEAIYSSLVTAIPVLVISIIYGIIQALGLWKAGTKFNSWLLKAGGIVLIVPVLNIIGNLLAGVGFLTVKEK